MLQVNAASKCLCLRAVDTVVHSKQCNVVPCLFDVATASSVNSSKKYFCAHHQTCGELTEGYGCQYVTSVDLASCCRWTCIQLLGLREVREQPERLADQGGQEWPISYDCCPWLWSPGRVDATGTLPEPS